MNIKDPPPHNPNKHYKHIKMNFQKQLLAITFLIFSSTVLYSQDKPVPAEITDADFKKGVAVQLKIGQIKNFDAFSMLLTSFSHKRPMIDGPTKATAYITISQGNISEEITLSIHGIQGKPEAESEYESILWKGYKFDLKRFNYDDFIQVVITKEE